MWKLCLGGGVVMLAAASSVSAQAQGSQELAKELTSLVVAQHIDAVAALEPDTTDRFVAALVFPNAQLLVVGARYPAPAVLMQQLAAKDYKEAYLSLQQSGLRDGKIFFQDMGADGLRRDGGAVDVLYENDGAQFLFDRAHRPNGVSEAAYDQRVAKADTQYCHLLTLLVAQLKLTATASKP
jgi:hypothetical protein